MSKTITVSDETYEKIKKQIKNDEDDENTVNFDTLELEKEQGSYKINYNTKNEFKGTPKWTLLKINPTEKTIVIYGMAKGFANQGYKIEVTMPSEYKIEAD